MEKTAERVFDEIQAKGGYELSDAKSRDYFIDGFNKAMKIARTELNNTVDLGSVIKWVAFDWVKIETRPTKHGKHLITRKDGKIHWETWNGNGWAYNHNEIRFWAEIEPPVL